MFKLVYKLFAFVKTTVNMVKLKNISVSLTSYFKEKKIKKMRTTTKHRCRNNET